MNTVIWRDTKGCILRYPEQFNAQLVSKPYGHDRSSCSKEPCLSSASNEKRKKRKRRHSTRSLNEGETLQEQHFKDIRESLISCYQSLLDIGHKIGYFPIQQLIETPDSSKSLSIDFAALCDLDKLIPVTEDRVEVLTQDYADKEIDVFNKIVQNIGSCDIHMTIWGHSAIIPSHSTFLLSDISKIQLLVQFTVTKSISYNLIVLDPPWENRSAIRGGKYRWLRNEDILCLPIRELLAPEGLVAIWVTNKRKLVQWVMDVLLPHWGLVGVAEWTWLKVTTKGDFVFNIDSVHKKPYETLIIGRACKSDLHKTQCPPLSHLTNKEDHEPATKTPKINDSLDVKDDQLVMKSSLHSSDETSDIKSTLCDSNSCIPSCYTLLCVPSIIHSQKPYLGDILQSYIIGELKGLELFARNLHTGWTSWGNEVLQFQVLS